MDVISSNHGNRVISTVSEHPGLSKTDAASVRAFLRLYDQYTRELTERAPQIVGNDVISTKAVRLARLKFRVNPGWLDSLIDFNFIPRCPLVIHSKTRSFENFWKRKSKIQDVVTIDTLGKLTKEELWINMTDLDARSRSQTVFVLYCSISRRHGFLGLTDDKE